MDQTTKPIHWLPTVTGSPGLSPLDAPDALRTWAYSARSIALRVSSTAAAKPLQSLGRNGILSLVLLMDQHGGYVIDGLALPRNIGLREALRDICEDPSITKVVNDCRWAADALWHHLHINLDGVHDLRIHNRYHGRAGWSSEPSMYDALARFGICPSHSHLVKHRLKGRWTDRPLSESLLRWASLDVHHWPLLAERQKLSFATPSAEIERQRFTFIKGLTYRNLQFRMFPEMILSARRSESALARLIGHGGGNLGIIEELFGVMVAIRCNRHRLIHPQNTPSMTSSPLDEVMGEMKDEKIHVYGSYWSTQVFRKYFNVLEKKTVPNHVARKLATSDFPPSYSLSSLPYARMSSMFRFGFKPAVLQFEEQMT